MSQRTRKLLGTAAILAFVMVYALVVMAAAQMPVVRLASGWVQGIFYVVGGLAWIFPLMPLIRWMERADRA